MIKKIADLKGQIDCPYCFSLLQWDQISDVKVSNGNKYVECPECGRSLMLNQSIDYWVSDNEQEQNQIDVGYKTVTTQEEIYSLTFTTTEKDNNYYILRETINEQDLPQLLWNRISHYSLIEEEFVNNINSFYDNTQTQIRIINQERFQILEATETPSFSIIYVFPDTQDGDILRVCRTTEPGQHTLVIKEKGQETIVTTEQFNKAVNSVISPEVIIVSQQTTTTEGENKLVLSHDFNTIYNYLLNNIPCLLETHDGYISSLKIVQEKMENSNWITSSWIGMESMTDKIELFKQEFKWYNDETYSIRTSTTAQVEASK